MNTPTTVAATDAPHLRNGTLFVDEAKFAVKGPRTAVVVIRSDNEDLPRSIEDLSSMRAKQLALMYAASRGISGAALNGMASPYPLAAGDVPLGDLIDKGHKLTDPECKVVGYAIAIPVTAT